MRASRCVWRASCAQCGVSPEAGIGAETGPRTLTGVVSAAAATTQLLWHTICAQLCVMAVRSPLTGLPGQRPRGERRTEGGRGGEGRCGYVTGRQQAQAASRSGMGWARGKAKQARAHSEQNGRRPMSRTQGHRARHSRCGPLATVTQACLPKEGHGTHRETPPPGKPPPAVASPPGAAMPAAALS